MRRGNGCVRRCAHVQVYIRVHTHTHTSCMRMSAISSRSNVEAPFGCPSEIQSLYVRRYFSRAAVALTSKMSFSICLWIIAALRSTSSEGCKRHDIGRDKRCAYVCTCFMQSSIRTYTPSSSEGLISQRVMSVAHRRNGSP